MFRLKICGVRLKTDLEAVEASGGDAVGFNFFPPSVRFLDPWSQTTRELVEQAESLPLLRVGVFVNETELDLLRVAENLKLDAVQLHGDEACDVASSLISQGLRVIRAIKLPRGDLTPQQIAVAVKPWTDLGAHLLLDADVGTQHGGVGAKLDWAAVGAWSQENPEVTWSLAGGLTVDNVASAIELSHAKSVDVASGVEEPRGRKSPRLIQEFAHLALQQW